MQRCPTDLLPLQDAVRLWDSEVMEKWGHNSGGSVLQKAAGWLQVLGC